MAQDIEKKIKRLRSNLIDLKTKIREFIIEAIEENEELVLELNRTQLEDGTGADGKAITPEYASDKYASKKQALGSQAPFGTPDLKLEGDFQDNFELEFFKEAADIFSTDFKSEFLEKKYGREKIYGLTTDSQVKVILAILPSVQLKARTFVLNN